MPKEPAAKSQNEELEPAKASASPKAEKPAADLAPGTVLDEDDEFETVVVKRKKTARPTGRYVAIANYRFVVADAKYSQAMKKQGASVDDAPDGKSFIIGLRPGAAGYDLPDDVAEHALAAGAVEREMR